MDIVAVLVVPAEGDPGGLLAPGRMAVVNEPPALVNTCPGCGVWGHHGCAHPPVTRWTNALPLWWDGALVPEGWDRARRVRSARRAVHGSMGPAVAVETLWPTVRQALDMGASLVAHGAAERVVRLARVDGRLVEVT